MSIEAFLTVRETDVELSDGGDVSAPLPFVGFSFRYGITPKTRLVSDFGWLSVKVGDVEGSQLLGSVAIEYLAWKHFAFGGLLARSGVDVEVTGNEDFTGTIDTGNTNFSIYVKGRW